MKPAQAGGRCSAAAEANSAGGFRQVRTAPTAARKACGNLATTGDRHSTVDEVAVRRTKNCPGLSVW